MRIPLFFRESARLPSSRQEVLIVAASQKIQLFSLESLCFSPGILASGKGLHKRVLLHPYGALRPPGGPPKGLIGNSRINWKTNEKLRKTKNSRKPQENQGHLQYKVDGLVLWLAGR